MGGKLTRKNTGVPPKKKDTRTNHRTKKGQRPEKGRDQPGGAGANGSQADEAKGPRGNRYKIYSNINDIYIYIYIIYI